MLSSLRRVRSHDLCAVDPYLATSLQWQCQINHFQECLSLVLSANHLHFMQVKMTLGKASLVSLDHTAKTNLELKFKREFACSPVKSWPPMDILPWPAGQLTVPFLLCSWELHSLSVLAPPWLAGHLHYSFPATHSSSQDRLRIGTFSRERRLALPQGCAPHSTDHSQHP